MKGKLITFGLLIALVFGAGLAINQIKTNPKATLSASSLSTPLEVNNDYAQSSVKVGAKTFAVELALTAEQQSLGLSNRNSLVSNAGMLFVFKPAEAATFWMKDMKFPLDMIWIYQGKVIAIDKNLPIPKTGTAPADLPTYSPKTPVDYVLEINAGASVGIGIGDRFELATSSSV